MVCTGTAFSVRTCPSKLALQNICAHAHLYLFQSRNRLLLRRAIGRFAFPAHASVSSDHAPLIIRTRYLPVIISYRPSFSLRSASGAPCQPDNSVLTHITHSCFFFFFFFFLSTERIDESYIKAPTATSNCRLTTSEDAWAFFGR